MTAARSFQRQKSLKSSRLFTEITGRAYQDYIGLSVSQKSQRRLFNSKEVIKSTRGFNACTKEPASINVDCFYLLQSIKNEEMPDINVLRKLNLYVESCPEASRLMGWMLFNKNYWHHILVWLSYTNKEKTISYYRSSQKGNYEAKNSVHRRLILNLLRVIIVNTIKDHDTKVKKQTTEKDLFAGF